MNVQRPSTEVQPGFPAQLAHVPAHAHNLAFTLITNKRGPLTKTFKVNPDDPNGKPASTTAAKLYEGMAQKVVCSDLREFVRLLQTLQPNQALAYGLTGRELADVVTKEELAKGGRPGAIARDSKHFQYRVGPGVWMLDYDAGYLTESFEDAEALRHALLKALPYLDMAPMAWTASASTHIYNADTGQLVKGLGGQRIYLPVTDASDIPRAHKALRDYCWAVGTGAYSISRSGQLIERSLFDLMTAQPERLDFAAGANCVTPLEQRRPEPKVFEAEIIGGVDAINLRDFVPDPDGAIKERAEEHRAAARAKADIERQRVRQAYINERVEELVKSGVPRERAESTAQQAVNGDQLFADFVLHPEVGGTVTVGEMLDNPQRWHGTRFSDPLEPEYGNDCRIAWVNLRGGGRPYIYSHAHGGKRYELFRQPTILDVKGGDAPRLADACLNLMRAQGEVFDGAADGMLRVGVDGRVYPVSPAWLTDHLGHIAQFQKFDSRSSKTRAVDVPPLVPQSIIAREGQRNLSRLEAVCTAPTLRKDGSMLDTPGYDPASRLLYQPTGLDAPSVPEAPSLETVNRALHSLWRPVAMFPFDGSVSRGVMLAALLTVCVRRSLPTSPAFAFDAPAAGSGKTLLARCVAKLGGFDEATTALPRDEDERRKAIFAMLRAGAGTIVFDNISTPLAGEAFDHALTAPMYSQRVLGESRSETVPNRTMVMVTGNNIATRGDTNRRVLRCRIDPRDERPYSRSFPFNPAQLIESQRLELVVAALTIIRGYLKAGARPGNLASFEDWDYLVRGAVLWLGSVQSEIALADPVDSVTSAEDEDTYKGAISELLSTWYRALGSKPISASAVLEASNETDGDDLEGTLASGRSALAVALEAAVIGDTRFLRGALPQLTPKALGEWLTRHRDFVGGGHRLERVGHDRNKSALWRVTSLEAAYA